MPVVMLRGAATKAWRWTRVTIPTTTPREPYTRGARNTTEQGLGLLPLARRGEEQASPGPCFGRRASHRGEQDGVSAGTDRHGRSETPPCSIRLAGRTERVASPARKAKGGDTLRAALLLGMPGPSTGHNGMPSPRRRRCGWRWQDPRDTLCRHRRAANSTDAAPGRMARPSRALPLCPGAARPSDQRRMAGESNPCHALPVVSRRLQLPVDAVARLRVSRHGASSISFSCLSASGRRHALQDAFCNGPASGMLHAGLCLVRGPPFLLQVRGSRRMQPSTDWTGRDYVVDGTRRQNVTMACNTLHIQAYMGSWEALVRNPLGVVGLRGGARLGRCPPSTRQKTCVSRPGGPCVLCVRLPSSDDAAAPRPSSACGSDTTRVALCALSSRPRNCSVARPRRVGLFHAHLWSGDSVLCGRRRLPQASRPRYVVCRIPSYVASSVWVGLPAAFF